MKEKTTPLWQREFGKDWEVPQEVQNLVECGFLEDESWHNDVAPKWRIRMEDSAGPDPDPGDMDGYWLWIDSADREDREFEELNRYRIEVVSGAGRDSDFLVDSEAVDELLTYLVAMSASVGFAEGVTLEEIQRVKGELADLCDGNMVMAAAFKSVFGREPVLPCDVHEGKATQEQEDYDLSIWNAAIPIIRKNRYFLPSIPSRNTNCLEGMRCPECGHEDAFQIVASSVWTVTDNGTEDYGDVEWDADSECYCCSCDHAGTVKDFYIEK